MSIKRHKWESALADLHTFVIRKQEKAGRAAGKKGRACLILQVTLKHIQMDHLEIDFTLTFKELRQWFVAYNKKLKDSEPLAYKKRSLKSTHMETAREIIRFYGAHLYKNKNNNWTERRFWITNTGIAKQKLQHRSTIYRHLLILQEAGVVTHKIYHGTNCGFEVEINPLILVAKSCIVRSINRGHELTAANIPYEKREEILNAKNTFAHLSKSYVASCNQTDSSNLQETNNVNMHTKGVDNFFYDLKGAGNKEASQCIQPQKEESPTPEATAGNPTTLGARALEIERYTQHSWKFAKSLLWGKKTFIDTEEAAAKVCIREYYELIPEEKFEASAPGLFESFCERILLAHQYIRKSPERFIPVPWVWLDRRFEHGFRGTLAWLKATREKRKKTKGYYTNLTLLVKAYKYYQNNPCIHTFRQAEEVLKQKKDEKVLDLFYSCVLDKEKFNSDHLQQYDRA